MEESEKRRERLKAMRMEAAQAGVDKDTVSPTVSYGFYNPLIETCATPSLQMDSCATPRFDYYTDPMSAFSANKRRSRVSHQISQGYFTPPRPTNPEMIPSLAHQTQMNNSPDQRMFQAQGFHYGSGPYRSPVGMASPFGMQQGTPPGVWNGSGVTPSYGFPSYPSRGANFPRPDFGQGGSPISNSGQGRGSWSNYSPGPGRGCGGGPGTNSGRGQGRWSDNSMSPGSRQSQRKGLGSRDNVSAELRPDLYYKKSMVDDPWKFLQPVIWKRENVPMKILNTPDSPKSWLPKSISIKKARVPEASKDASQLSLAEYLAASFNEAINKEAVNDGPSV